MSERASILIVDDAPENLEYLSSILSPIYKVRAASNGERALAIVMSETPPDLILLDIMMPGIDGYEVCRQIKASPVRRSIPILFVTALGEDTEEAKGLAMGAQDYISKPYSASIVLARVNTQLVLNTQSRELECANTALSHTLGHLQQTQSELVENQKLAALGRMVAGLAHELNTPIGIALTTCTAMGSWVRTLSNSIEQGELKRSSLIDYLQHTSEASEVLERALNRCAYLVESFKKLTIRDEDAVFSTFDLSDIVTMACYPVSDLLQAAGIQLQTHVAPIQMLSCPMLIVDVFNHLIRNAQEHAFIDQVQPLICIEAAARDGFVTISVSDNGCGIPEALQDRIFEPMFTVTLGNGGLGLGLSIVWDIVTNRLGGSIRVQNQLGGGCRFVMVLPQELKPSANAL